MQAIDKSRAKSSLHPGVPPMPVRTIAGIAVADTPLVKRAYQIAREHLDPYLFNHVVRSWLFATLIAEQKGDPYDAEVLAVSTMLHDIGLSEAFVGPLRFEVEGANVARELASSFDVDIRRAQLIWDSIALNSTPSICLHKETEAALCTLGVALDWGGWGYERLPAQQIARIIEEFPRLAMKRRFAQAICGLCEQRPETTHDNFARDFGTRYVADYEVPSMVDTLLNAPFEE
jgi:hypothetical protein